MSKNKSVANAVESARKGDVRGLRKSIHEALVEKIRKALQKKEQDIAKSYLGEVAYFQEESPSTAEKIALHLKHILKVAPGKDRANVANQIMNLVGKDKSFKNPKFDKAFGKLLPLATTENKVLRTEFEKAVTDVMNSLHLDEAFCIGEGWEGEFKAFQWVADVGSKKVAQTIKTKAFADYFIKNFDFHRHVTTSSNYTHGDKNLSNSTGAELQNSPWYITKAGITSLKRGIDGVLSSKKNWGANIASQIVSNLSDDDLVKIVNHLHNKEGWKPVSGIKG